MTPRQQRSARLRAGLLAAAVASALLPAICAGSPAGASPAPGRAAAAGGYLYWSNTLGPGLKPGDGMIVRARQDGGDVNQKFITGGSFPDAIAAGSRYLYWTNAAVGGNPNRRAIGRARLNGTDVKQRFVARKDFVNLRGVAVGPGR
jgi:Low-density lipoprotein receptor repeat class B